MMVEGAIGVVPTVVTGEESQEEIITTVYTHFHTLATTNVFTYVWHCHLNLSVLHQEPLLPPWCPPPHPTCSRTTSDAKLYTAVPTGTALFAAAPDHECQDIATNVVSTGNSLLCSLTPFASALANKLPTICPIRNGRCHQHLVHQHIVR